MNNLLIHIIQLSEDRLPAPLCFSAVFFDTATGELGEELFIKIDPASCRSAGLDVSPEALRGWIGKQQEMDLISDDMKVSLRLAVNMLSGFAFMDSKHMVLKPFENRLQVWGDGLSVLRDYHEAVSAPYHWANANINDFPTLSYIGDQLGFKWQMLGEEHPLDIAKSQAKYICSIFSALAPKLRLISN